MFAGTLTYPVDHLNGAGQQQTLLELSRLSRLLLKALCGQRLCRPSLFSTKRRN